MNTGFATVDELLLGGVRLQITTQRRVETNSSKQQTINNKNKMKWARSNGSRFYSLLIGVSFGAWHSVG